MELKAGQMSNDTGHYYGALAPWWAEVEIELVILHEGIATNAVL